MDIISKIFTSIIVKINGLIDSMSYKTINSIKRGFFFFIFVMCIVGIVIGYRIGSGGAKIKSSPLTEYVNDTFRMDISKADGNFSEILQNEMLSEAPMNNFNKYDFPSREDFNPEFKKGIMESDSKIPDPDIADKPFKPETPIDDSSNISKFAQTQSSQSIKILDKPKVNEAKTDVNKSNSIFNDEQPFSKTEVKNSDNNIIKILDKDGKENNTIPQPIKNDTGIIDR
ncbi:MAG: hypothetical protein FWG49_07475 [Leptospirales bacterium]|nr:hypothetical protein [Leptospirales bacterium]